MDSLVAVAGQLDLPEDRAELARGSDNGLRLVVNAQFRKLRRLREVDEVRRPPLLEGEDVELPGDSWSGGL
jgi:hypothetical protein